MKNNTASSGTKTRGRAATGGAPRSRRTANQTQNNTNGGAPNGGVAQSAEGFDWSKQNKTAIGLLKKQITQATAIGVQMKKSYEQHEALLKNQKALLQQYETA